MLIDYFKALMAELFGPKPGELCLSRNDDIPSERYAPVTDAKNIQTL